VGGSELPFGNGAAFGGSVALRDSQGKELPWDRSCLWSLQARGAAFEGRHRSAARWKSIRHTTAVYGQWLFDTLAPCDASLAAPALRGPTSKQWGRYRHRLLKSQREALREPPDGRATGTRHKLGHWANFAEGTHRMVDIRAVVGDCDTKSSHCPKLLKVHPPTPLVSPSPDCL
jgi:hypothetical protein